MASKLQGSSKRVLPCQVTLDQLICASLSHTHFCYEVRMLKCNWLKRVQSAAAFRFFERHVVELEKQLRMGYQHGFFQNMKSVKLEETNKVESQCVCDEERG